MRITLVRPLQSSLLCLAICFCLTINACELKYAVSGNFPPFHIKQPDGGWDGISIRLFKQLADRINCRVMVVDVPWSRSLSLLKMGTIDAISHVSRRPEREQYSHFVGPLAIETMVLLARKELAVRFNHHDDLRNQTLLIGKTMGTEYGGETDQILSRFKQEEQLVELISNRKLLEMLIAGRLDGFVEEETVAKRHFRQGTLNHEKFAILFELGQDPVFFAFSKRSVDEALLSEIDAVWQQMHREELIQAAYQAFNEAMPFTPGSD